MITPPTSQPKLNFHGNHANAESADGPNTVLADCHCMTVLVFGEQEIAGGGTLQFGHSYQLIHENQQLKAFFNHGWLIEVGKNTILHQTQSQIGLVALQ